jgi:osmotically-inducible protein OsmY
MSKLSKGATLAIGAIAAYLFDPDNGKARRARIKDQAASAARSLKEETSAQAKYQRNVMEGLVHEAKSAMRPPREFDDNTLVQKVRSEVLGSWIAQGNPPVEAEASNGTVTLTTTISDPQQQDDLVQRVRRVEGVKDVTLQDGLSEPGESKA